MTRTEQFQAEQIVGLRRQVSALEDALQRIPAHDDSPWRPAIAADMPAAAAKAYNGLFDIYSITSTTFKIRGLQASTGAAWIAGIKKSIGVSGMTWSTDHWESGTLTTSEYVYLKGDRAGLTWTMTMATTLPDSDGTFLIKPQWYVPFASSAITKSGIVDMRHAMQIEAMA